MIAQRNIAATRHAPILGALLALRALVSNVVLVVVVLITRPQCGMRT